MNNDNPTYASLGFIEELILGEIRKYLISGERTGKNLTPRIKRILNAKWKEFLKSTPTDVPLKGSFRREIMDANRSEEPELEIST